MDQRSAVRADFDRGAKEYDALRPEAHPLLRRLLRQRAPADPVRAGRCVRRAGPRRGHWIARGAHRATLPESAAHADRHRGRDVWTAPANASPTVADVRIIAADYSATDLPGPFDVVASALSIHHLEHEEKRALFRRILHALNPGGVFVNADDVLAPSTRLHAEYHAEWLRQAGALGATADELAAAEDRQKHDRLAPLLDQLRWLNDAGFADVDCYYKYLTFSVFGGRRPPAG